MRRVGSPIDSGVPRLSNLGVIDELRRKFGPQLKRDPDKDFDTEFERTTDLERRLIDDYGFEGIRVLLEDPDRESLYPHGSFPGDCPWVHLNRLSKAEGVQSVFAPIAERLPSLMAVLDDRCEYLYAERRPDRWVLHYLLTMKLYDGRRYFNIYPGGPPNLQPEPNPRLTKYDWLIPDDLARLYRVHDGFGPILGSDQLEVMAEAMDPICAELRAYPEAYEYCDLLPFHHDDAGNNQAFYRGDGAMTTVDWDHEVWEISAGREFFEYVDATLSDLDEE